MHINMKSLATLGLLVVLSGCEHEFAVTPEPLSTFGEANRQTMMAQVVDPSPVYEDLNPPTSGQQAGEAVKRYREGSVKEPEQIRSTSAARSSGGGS